MIKITRAHCGSLPLLFPPLPLTWAWKKAASSLLSSSSSLTVVFLLSAAWQPGSLASQFMWPSLASRQDSIALTEAQLMILLYLLTITERVPGVPGTPVILDWWRSLASAIPWTRSCRFLLPSAHRPTTSPCRPLSPTNSSRRVTNGPVCPLAVLW